MMSAPRPALLCILDGWGWRDDKKDNAIAEAKTPNYTRMLLDCPHALLRTSGRAVGLPHGQMGNSEVGHMNIGSGRVVAQDLPRIDVAIEDGSLGNRPALRELITKAQAAQGGVHLMGLLSPGGVHSHQDHMAALVKILAEAKLPVFVHAFLDGRDTPPRSAKGFIEKFLKDIEGVPGVRMATVSGRYYAMDRDARWDRVKKTYDALVDADAPRRSDIFAALEASYAENVNDEFVVPAVLGDYAGMADGDALLFANFRADRAREISLALLDKGFNAFERSRVVKFSAATGMTEYSVELAAMMTAIFPPEDVRETLGEVMAERGLKQLRIAETEKYAHVTFFLNGGREEPFPGEDRILVPSPKVSTYDHRPEMSAHEVTSKLVEAIGSGKYDLIVANYANPDMVGHTGMMDAAVKAVDTIDECLGQLRAAIEKAHGVMLLTADHGNIEMMKDPKTGEPHTAHTTFEVPIVAVNAPKGTQLEDGRLADVAPTLLALMGIPQPAPMTGHSLLKKG
ncbi:MAG TPA: 2,3-bisphosphoglycerate-independent phosphoglycerate mutase [Rhizomicrobium sp.]|jgi:2,3-bisphosphoglycerate-independent phosphoglycerate mutase|nr:2,3-bisphosphoglycerate-independent phosphoglycerate mutase [Rhizomicrobium sp.]